MTRVGTKIGSIRLTSVLGRGGMGEVYEGFDETLQRLVAVKSLRHDRALDTEIKARFLHEARILSSLHHPNICLVHDFVQDANDAFLVMEKIDGKNLNQRVEAGLDRRQKLDIAVQLADVLTAAHARGIVHRDLKPDNVMLTAEGVAKVLDFGIARLEGAPHMARGSSRPAPAGDGETTIIDPIDTISPTLWTPISSPPRTTAGTVIGTPAYMSPEQALGLEASPASDIYSLGLVLQYLFTESSPYDPELDTMGLLQQARRGESRPVDGIGNDLAGLIRRMKSLSPEDRPTAPSVAHRLRKICSKPARRARWAAAAALLMAAAGFGVKYTVDLRHEREQALAAQAEAEVARDEAEAVSEFLVDLLGSAAPEETLGDDVTVRQVLDAAAAELRDANDLKMSTQARYLEVVGSVYNKLGLYDDAHAAITDALAIVDGGAAVGPRLEADIRVELGHLEKRFGNLDAARRHYNRASAIYEQHMPDDLRARGVILGALGNVQYHEGDYEGTYASFSEGLRLFREAPAIDNRRIAVMLGSLGNALAQLDECDGAIEAYREAAEIFEHEFGEYHPMVASALNNMAGCLDYQERFDEAHEVLERALSIRSMVYGADHHQTSSTMTNLGWIKVRLGLLDEAEALLEQGAAIISTTIGENQPEFIYNLIARVDLLEARGDIPAAIQIAGNARHRAAELGVVHPVVSRAQDRYLDLLLNQGRHEQALEVATEDLDHRIAILGTEDELVGEGWILVARARWAAGDAMGARAALEESLRLGWDPVDVTEPAELAELVREVAAEESLQS